MKYLITILFFFSAEFLCFARPLIDYSPADKEARQIKAENMQSVVPLDLPPGAKLLLMKAGTNSR